MNYRIGRYTVLDKEYWEDLIKSNILRDYDASPELREQHDKEAIMLNGKKIKCTQEEIWQYWRLRLKR